MTPPFAVQSYDFDGGRVVVPRGELDVSTCQVLTEHTTAPPGSLVVFDLSRLTFIDSSGLGAIHTARQRAIKAGGTVVVTRPSAMVHRVFELTGLDIWITDWDPDWSGDAPMEPAS